MKTNRKKLWCKIVGHRWIEGALQYGYLDCERCHHCEQYGDSEPWTVAHQLWQVKNWFRLKFYSLKYWAQRTFQKHDDDIPF
jgi:hypothetical protein